MLEAYIKDCFDFEQHLANLRSVTLPRVEINGFYFKNINFVNVNLTDVDFSNCTFDDCNFIECDFCFTTFKYCDFINSNYRKRTLFCNNNKQQFWSQCISFQFCDLARVIFRNNSSSLIASSQFLCCNLRWDLWNEFPDYYIPMHCPEEGEFVGWKKARVLVKVGDDDYYYDEQNVIVKLLIPAHAKRSSTPLTSNSIYSSTKCRCSEAKVIAVYDIEGNELSSDTEITSLYDCHYHYKVGDIIKPTEPFNENRFIECASGIHFFMNRKEAINY